ncbi:MAG TPA: hypothetical protein VH206_20630 [Xanthobacteraceae bacterium]|nr:hypothetical protein [Xanthobacteraceae bacterium]
MLAEAFMLRLETTLRGTAPTTTQTSTPQFVLFTGGNIGRAGKDKAAKKV